MNAKTFFHELGDKIAQLFGHFPKTWLEATDLIIERLNWAKGFLTNPGVITLAALFPNGIGTAIDGALVALINETLPELEIAKDCETAVAGITDPAQKANVILQTIFNDLGKLPAEWQGKHFEDVAITILKALLNITTTEAKAILNVRYGVQAAALHA